MSKLRSALAKISISGFFNKGPKRMAIGVWSFLLLLSGIASAGVLENIDYRVLPGDRVEIRLTMDQPTDAPKAFKTENPARIALDFKGVESSLAKKNQDIGVGSAKSITAVTVGGRTRVVLNLVSMVPYQTRMEGNQFVITLGNAGPVIESNTFNASAKVTSKSPTAGAEHLVISKVDFRRGPAGEGRVVLDLNNNNASIDLRQEGRSVIADFYNTEINEELVRKLDVIDFATPAELIETQRRGGNVRLTIKGNEEYEYLAFQSENQFTIELKPLTQEEADKRKKDKLVYTGDRMTLNFQQVGVRGVLQVIANQANLNLVASDTVQGNVTLRLENVPWDQALDIILKSKGLGKRQNGNVLMVAPADEIAAREKLELQAEQQVQQLAPTRSEYIQINYAKAADIAALLKGAENSLLSERGSVTIDERTNTLLVQDTSLRLEEVRNLVNVLDIPVREVMIEARIVTANDGFSRELGVRWGLTDKNSQSGFSGSLEGAESIASGVTPPLNQRLNVNLPVSSAAGSIGFNVAKLTDGTLLDLELSALQSENLGEVVASPRILTTNQKEAVIKSGEEIPFLQSTSSGAASISFKEAVLSLTVTPQITPDNRIILDLHVTQNTRGTETVQGPAINTQELETQVLVNNGETIVLGGIYQQKTREDETKVPVLGDLPFVGSLFKSSLREQSKEELLIFVTPKIIKQESR
jgi:type IV pilus assembly protein PilQ